MRIKSDFLWDRNIRILLIFILLGIFLRLILMPTTLHVDLLSASFRQYLFVDSKIFRLFMLPEAFLSSYFVVIKPYIHLIPEVVNKTIESGQYGVYAEATDTVDLFARSSVAMRTLFVLKLPYLLFEVLLIPVVLGMFKNSREKLWFFALWWLNPLILYSTYAWGRYDIFAIFLVLISLSYARQKKDAKSFIFLGIAIACRESFALVLPLYLIYFHKNYVKMIINLLIAFLPTMLGSIVFDFLKSQNSSVISTLVVDSKIFSFSIDYALKAKLGSPWLEISPLLVLLPLLYYLFYRKEQRSFLNLLSFSTSVMIVFLSLSYIHVHYLLWLTPFFVYSMIFNKKILWPVIVYLISAFLYFDAFFGANVSLAMFRPLNYELFSNVGSITDTLFFSIRKENLLVILNTARLASGGIVVYLLLKKNNEIKAEN